MYEREAAFIWNAKGAVMSNDKDRRPRIWRVVCFNCKERGHFRRDCPLAKGNTATKNEPEAAICEEGRPLRCRHYAQIKRECGHCPNCPAAVLFDPDSDDEGGSDVGAPTPGEETQSMRPEGTPSIES